MANVVDQDIELSEILVRIGETQEAVRQTHSNESLGLLAIVANLLEGREVQVSGTLTNRELEWAGRVTPVNNLLARVTGVVIDTEAPTDPESIILGTEFPIVTFVARTLDTNERLVGELHQDGVTLQPVDAAY